MIPQPTTLITINPKEGIRCSLGSRPLVHHCLPGLMLYQCCNLVSCPRLRTTSSRGQPERPARLAVVRKAFSQSSHHCMLDGYSRADRWLIIWEWCHQIHAGSGATGDTCKYSNHKVASFDNKLPTGCGAWSACYNYEATANNLDNKQL